ncbi:enoyl-CoA hydratase-related protein [Streptomyces sp. NPDC047072]|uniref:enoyl-CoA hydratase-related protein n=1 Tax=Streptomyces sp. NPDC047072 TaxID=3154809 RepID=UPI0033F10B35
MSELLHVVEGRVAYLTLNRPEALNALTPAQRDRIIELLGQASADPDVRAVVLTGTGRGFCAGADLRGGSAGGDSAGGGSAGGGKQAAEASSERGAGASGGERGAEAGSSEHGGEADSREHGTEADSREHGTEAGSRERGTEAGSRERGTEAGSRERRTDTAGGAQAAEAPGGGERIPGDVARMIRDGAQRLIAAVLDCEKPVIAAVNGTAAGLGAHLALACDLVLAAESARFIEVFVRRALVPDGGGAYLLPRLIGPQRAKELMFFGDALSAADAERLGLVNRVVPDGELEKTAREWATRLAAGPTRTLALTKHLVNASLDSDRATAFAAEATAQEINMTTADAQEGLASFVERRTPEYRGR